MLVQEKAVKVRPDPRPLYVRAEEALERLLTDSFQAGDRLPPDPQLAAQLGVSHSTLREAMRAFEDRGIIRRRQGVGTFVIAPPSEHMIESGLESLESLDSLARRQGLDLADRHVKIAAGSADESIAETLDLPAGSPINAITRTKTVNSRPVAHMVDILPAGIVSLADLRTGYKGSVLDFLLERGAPPLNYARARIVPRHAGDELGAELGVPPKTPLLLIEQTLHSAGIGAVGFSRNYCLPDLFEFHVIRRIGG